VLPFKVEGPPPFTLTSGLIPLLIRRGQTSDAGQLGSPWRDTVNAVVPLRVLP
jgi:hypothetical protein